MKTNGAVKDNTLFCGHLNHEEVGDFKKRKFEYDHVVFWNWFTRTVGRSLGLHIERKTKTFLMDRGIVASSESEWQEQLSVIRRNFNNNPHAEIYKLKTLLLNSSSPLMQHFCENVANAPALDDVYNALGSFSWHNKKIWPASYEPDILSTFHLSCPLAQGVRNRYRIVMETYEASNGGSTLSIACGSAQPLIHAVQKLKEKGKASSVELILTDLESSSLQFALQRAKEAGVEEKISNLIEAPFQTLPNRFGEKKFDIIEACGICDYFSDKYIERKILKYIFSMLREGGLLITSGMAETPAADLLRKMYNWEIIYRPAETFASLVANAGGKNVKIQKEPWGIYYVVTATL